LLHPHRGLRASRLPPAAIFCPFGAAPYQFGELEDLRLRDACLFCFLLGLVDRHPFTEGVADHHQADNTGTGPAMDIDLGYSLSPL